MKVRNDFVTNSSSSSFIIDKNDVTRDKLKEILLEIANLEAADWYDPPNPHVFSQNDIGEDCVANRYHITEATPKKPYFDREGWYGREDESAYTHHYVINNESCGRYDWDIINDVMYKYGINFDYGYCD